MLTLLPNQASNVGDLTLLRLAIWDNIITIKILLTPSLGDKYDVIKPFLVCFQVKTRVPLSFVQ